MTAAIQTRPPKPPGVTAKEIAEGTGMSLSSVYRALHELEARHLVIGRAPEIRLGRNRRPEA